MVNLPEVLDRACALVRATRPEATVSADVESWDWPGRPRTYQVVLWDGQHNYTGPTPEAALAALRYAYEEPSERALAEVAVPEEAA